MYIVWCKYYKTLICFTSLLKMVFGGIVYIAWNWPSFNHLHHGNLQMLQTRNSISFFPPFFPSLLPFLTPSFPTFFFLKTLSSRPTSTRKRKTDKERWLNWAWEGQKQEEKRFEEMTEKHGLWDTQRVNMCTRWYRVDFARAARIAKQDNRHHLHSRVFQTVQNCRGWS